MTKLRASAIWPDYAVETGAQVIHKELKGREYNVSFERTSDTLWLVEVTMFDTRPEDYKKLILLGLFIN